MPLPRPTRRPQLGGYSRQQQQQQAQQQQAQQGEIIKKIWWKPLLNIRWSSFVILSMGIGILNLLNSHLIVHHDNNNHSRLSNMHASIREILRRHHQAEMMRGGRYNNKKQHHPTENSQAQEAQYYTHDETSLEQQNNNDVAATEEVEAAMTPPLSSSLEQQQQQQQHASLAAFKAQHALTEKKHHRRRPIEFLPTESLNLPLDGFSATWWQSRDRFLYQMNVENIGSVEGACFAAFNERDEQVKMTVDWLDFSVEHLSRWWKLLQYDLGPSKIAYHRILGNLLNYVQDAMAHEYEQRSLERARQALTPGIPKQWPTILLKKTIAVIAFMPYDSEARPVWGDYLTMVNLAATMASLARHGCGRIVVVTDENEVPFDMNGASGVGGGDAPSRSFHLIRGAFQLLEQASLRAESGKHAPLSSSSDSSSINATEAANLDWFKAAHDIMGRASPHKMKQNKQKGKQQHVVDPDADDNELPSLRIVQKVAGTEVAFVAVDPNYDHFDWDTNTTGTHYLVPKAGLEGLKQAMLGKSDNPTQWLGEQATNGNKRRLSHWRYVYLTEPDSILQTRPSALAQFAKRALQRDDALLVPHRLQPIPHESDVRGYKDNRYWVPELNEMEQVTVVDARTQEEKSSDSSQDDDDDEYDDACCDAGIHRPKDDYDSCGNFWYVCGFQDGDSVDENYNKTDLERLPKYERMFPYRLIRLKHGTGITSLAATPHGRQCLPTKLKKNQLCPIPPVPSASSSETTDDNKSENSRTKQESDGGDKSENSRTKQESDGDDASDRKRKNDRSREGSDAGTDHAAKKSLTQ